MALKFFCPRWGSEALDWKLFLNKVKNARFQGIEYGISSQTTRAELDEVWNLCSGLELEVIPQHYDTYHANFAEHKAHYAAWLELIKPYPAPLINSQTGKDFFTFEQNSEVLAIATAHSAATGIRVCHETHRNKFSFAAHITRKFLEEIPKFELSLDISHWVNVAESYLEDQQETVELAISRTGHFHARVGYPEGPQVPDPRIPAWKESLDHHLAWWDKIVATRQSQGLDITITPEFGPYPYMVPLPASGEPIAPQWDVNVFMKDLLLERYS